MNFSPNLSSPTRSRRPDPTLLARRLVVVWAGLAAPLVWAHGDDAQALPMADGLRWGLQAAARALDASQALPSLSLPGYLVQGGAEANPQGLHLEHAVAELGLRWAQDWGAYLAVGRHGSDPTHTEAAWLQRSWVSDTSGRWTLQVGRQRPELGAALTRAGLGDDFALRPLAQQAMLNGDWIDDGAQLAWRLPPRDEWHVTLHAGLWRGRVFPGGPQASPVPSLHANVKWADWSADASLVRFDPRGRGARVQAPGGGHSHVGPDCNVISAQVLCFSGRTTLATAQLSWDPHPWPLSLTLATWGRRDLGQLGSAQGFADHQAHVRGAWVQAHWALAPPWSLALRVEGLNASYRLQGAGASLLARDAGLTAYAPARRVALVLGQRPDPRWQWGVELGREHLGRSSRYLAVRLRVNLESVHYATSR